MSTKEAAVRRSTIRAWQLCVGGAVVVALSGPWPAVSWAQGECTHPYYWGQLAGQTSVPNNCFGSGGFRCYRGDAGEPFFRLENPSCDPHAQACSVHLVVPFEFPGLIQMVDEDGLGGSPTPTIFWFDEATAGTCTSPNPCSPTQASICGTSAFGGKINKDFIETWVEKGGITCANALDQTGDYAIRAASCYTTACRQDEVVEGLTFDTPLLAIQIGCTFPPVEDCAEQTPGMCPQCRYGVGPAGGGPSGGAAGGPGGEGGRTGPGGLLHYRAGGVGHPDFPGTGAWNTELGRYWSHTYAMRIVIDPVTANDNHVWLLTAGGSFREFKNKVSGVYTTVRPSDEYRTLERTTGWELTDLDGTVHTFDSNGRWTQTVDRNGNETVGTYASGELTLVEFPDGRKEEFTYSSGRLDTITEVGVDGTSELEWSYTWSGLDLERIDRPDGTALEYTYGDANFPGYVTLVELIPTSGPARVVRGYEYDDFGNVVDMWRGATSPTDPDAVDRWRYSFDIPDLPSETEVTDPLGDVATYVIGRDGSSAKPKSLKPKVISVSGDCPSCGTGPNAQFEYADPDHPLRPTRMLDGNGNDTRFEYTDEGEIAVRIEAFGTARERATEWDYDPSFPRLVTEKRQPSVTGGSNERVTIWDRDSTGNATTVTIEGFENGSAFSYDTDTVFNDDTDGGGQPSSIDPPGYGTADQTTFTYHARGNGNLILASRTDPIIGDTDYGYDAFNRLARVIDPNGVALDTRYDDLDRVTHTIHRVTDSLPVTPTDPPETIQAGDLVTEHVYDAYGDLDHTILPEGNVVDYEYDGAGRLISIERRPDLSDRGERQLFTLDDAGNRTRVDLQAWSGSAWVTRSFTIYHYDTRCHLDRVEDADSEITEYAYDCNGNLERVWDAKHPSSGQTAPATQVYAYDDLDRLISVTQPWTGAGGGNAVTAYEYDVQDHLVEVTDAEGNVTAYVYSDRDLLTAEASQFLATGGGCGTFPDCTQNGCGCTRMIYNEHGELVESTDPRGVTVERTVDALDRVTLVEYPDSSLDTQYIYDDSGVPFSKGRLTEINRHVAHALAYDRFGRITADGGFTFSYDENGNPLTINASAVGESVYAYDYADRPSTLDFDDGTTNHPIVTAAAYEPFGPLVSVEFGNTVVETRLYDERYMPDRITAEDTTNTITLLDWEYYIDEVGHVEAIDDLVGSGSREFAYQDVHYFLTCAGGGAWATGATCNPVAADPLQWTYDRIGNRLSETREGTNTTYSYAANGASGNTPLLTEVGADAYDYDASGNLIEITRSSGPVHGYIYDDESRIAEITHSGGGSADLRYDGRSFLEVSTRSFNGTNWGIQPRYSLDGRLLALVRQRDYGSPFYDADHYEVLYFAGRPVAVAAAEPYTSAPTLTFYTTDHLGTPVLVTDDSGATVWDSGLEPFGADPTKNSVLNNSVFLRLPGQWDDFTWAEAHLDARLYYNVHRWYATDIGRYARLEPVRWLRHSTHYLYAQNRPTILIDPRGLAPCAGLEEPDPGTCCGTPIARAFRNVNSKRALYCANKDKPPITVSRGEKKGWIEVPDDDPPTAHYKPQGNPCIDWCICDHENFHIHQANIGRLKEISHNAAECEAYVRHLGCLNDLTKVGPFITATGSVSP